MAHDTTTATTTTTRWTNEQLDYELARRRRFPPASLRHFPDKVREEWITLADLRAEWHRTPIDHPDRDWRAWELALAERQAVHDPKRRFYRIVDLFDFH